MDWLIEKGAIYFLGWLAYALLFPALKAGFYIRQGFEYRYQCNEFEELIAKDGIKADELKPEYKDAYLSGYRKS